MSSHQPPKKPSNIPTDKQLEIVARRFRSSSELSWGIYFSELERFAKIMSLELRDFNSITDPVFTRVPGREDENVFLLKRQPTKIKRSAVKKEPLVLSGEEIIKLAEEFRSADLESNYLNRLLEIQGLVKEELPGGYLSHLDKNLGWGITVYPIKHDLHTLKDLLEATGIPEEVMRIARGPDGLERLYIGRPGLQHLMESMLRYQEEKRKSESISASPPRGDSKSRSEESEPKSPKDSGSPRSRGSRKS